MSPDELAGPRILLFACKFIFYILHSRVLNTFVMVLTVFISLNVLFSTHVVETTPCMHMLRWNYEWPQHLLL